jgi:hypothetical protein
MKKVGIVFGLAFIFGTLLFYIAFKYTPYNADKLMELAGDEGVLNADVFTDNIDDLIEYGLLIPVLDQQVFYIEIVLSGVFVVCLVAAIHMLVDKLFYKKFYESPSVMKAFRRGIIVFSVLIGWFFFRIIGGLSFLNFILMLILGIFLELLLIQFVDHE